MDYSSWLREPLGDYVETHDDDFNQENSFLGFKRALKKWGIVQDHLCRPDAIDSFRSGLSLSQLHSYRLLHEWWSGRIQSPALSQAAQRAIQEAASEQNAESGYESVDRELARLSESTYHKNLFMLFQLEFVHEFRQLHEDNFQAFCGFVQEQRQLCASDAAIQRVAWSFANIPADTYSQQNQHSDNDQVYILGDLVVSKLDVIPACIEACPWLQIRKARGGFPYYLWDVALQKTVKTDSLQSPPQYICVSHTWGRWRIEGEENPSLTIEGVPWLVPQNTKFKVQGIPNLLLQIFRSGYVWIDLFCIPQDRSERALLEIARQAAIFGNAEFAVAWLNDAIDWRCLRSATKWFSQSYLRKQSLAQCSEDQATIELNNDDQASLEELNELLLDTSQEVASDPGDDEKTSVVPWFTSLWTLQEVCLRPDMIVCDRYFQPLRAGPDVVITLDYLVAMASRHNSDQAEETLPSGENELRVDKTLERSLYVDKHSAEGEVGTADTSSAAAFDDLDTLLTMTSINSIHWTSPAAVFTSGQLRQCSQSRAEAIMSVVGATAWYKDYLSKHKKAPPEDNLVLGFYPAVFLQEASQTIGPTFFTAIACDMRFAQGAVSIANDEWNVVGDRKPVGSMLPFTSSETYIVPPHRIGFSIYAHPVVKTWNVQDDGSVCIKQAAILTAACFKNAGGHEYNPLKKDILWAPLPGQEDVMTLDSEISGFSGNVEVWLSTFSSPQQAPNIAVCLYQQVFYDEKTPAPQTGLLLKQIGTVRETGQIIMLKIGVYLANCRAAWDVESIGVDWLVI
ncbi:uncharacterized protein KY384_005754 [Bacidia gigantensis]|uniref:uncharacterized protein n=1 Tax=Bacidia gigantensis TaxID=2732470 RepID=UPI001D04627A|nr:uncharacterized protein KY384_005754 [Bacidia gigantensis]KAG8529119.1 hypothetical protein KY384_005754 [Bacidia gigantensis]